jgi:hypothetical protein
MSVPSQHDQSKKYYEESKVGKGGTNVLRLRECVFLAQRVHLTSSFSIGPIDHPQVTDCPEMHHTVPFCGESKQGSQSDVTMKMSPGHASPHQRHCILSCHGWR